MHSKDFNFGTHVPPFPQGNVRVAHKLTSSQIIDGSVPTALYPGRQRQAVFPFLYVHSELFGQFLAAHSSISQFFPEIVLKGHRHE